MALRALLSGSTAVGSGRKTRSRGKSLGVLPFVNEGADSTIEFLTDGITESIINSVSQLGGLRVVPRSLVFRYKGVQADPATIGVALNARTILTGRVSQQGDYLTIQAELVDTATESQLWGEQFRHETERAAEPAAGHRVADLRSASAQADWRAEEETAEARQRQPRGLPGVLARTPLLQCLVARRLPKGARALRASDRARPRLCARLCGPRRRYRLHVVLRPDFAARRLSARPRRRREGDRPRSPTSPMPMERSRSAACSAGSTGRKPRGSSAARLRSIPSSPACARSTPSCSPRSAAMTMPSPRRASRRSSTRCRRSST